MSRPNTPNAAEPIAGEPRAKPAAADKLFPPERLPGRPSGADPTDRRARAADASLQAALQRPATTSAAAVLEGDAAAAAGPAGGAARRPPSIDSTELEAIFEGARPPASTGGAAFADSSELTTVSARLEMVAARLDALCSDRGACRQRSRPESLAVGGIGVILLSWSVTAGFVGADLQTAMLGIAAANVAFIASMTRR